MGTARQADKEAEISAPVTETITRNSHRIRSPPALAFCRINKKSPCPHRGVRLLASAIPPYQPFSGFLIIQYGNSQRHTAPYTGFLITVKNPSRPTCPS